MKSGSITFLSGILFGLGLCVSEMVNPKKVLAFLDIAGNWDPSLGVVMIAALCVTALSFKWITRKEKPMFCDKFNLPASKKVDGKLIVGSAIFGIGWGLVGFCPGPAVTSLAFGLVGSWIFVMSMIVGMILYHILYEKRT